MGGDTMSSNRDLLAKVIDPSNWPNTDAGRAAHNALADALAAATAHISDPDKKVEFGKTILSTLMMVLSIAGV